MCESDSYKMLVKSCDNIANTLEKIYEDNFFIEDEENGDYYYFDDDIYNLDYVWRKGYGLIGMRIMVACGGPNIWIDTLEEAVCGYWGTDVYKAYLTTACVNAINDYFAEYAKEDIYYDKVD